MEGNREIENKTLAEIKQECDDYAKEHNLSQHQADQYTIGKLSEKVIELEKIIQDRAK